MFADWFASRAGASGAEAASAGASAGGAAPKASGAGGGGGGVGGFLLDALYGVFGMERKRGDPHASSTAEKYPWVEFVDRRSRGADGEPLRAYRNKDSGEVTTVKPPDFDKFGSAQELDTTTAALVVVKRDKTRWESYADMLADSPIFRAMNDAVRLVKESPVGEAVADARERVEEARERARESWETSQNPIVYRASGAYDAMFGETEQAKAMAAIHRLDPDFDAGPDFLADMKRRLIPDVVQAFLRGDRLTLAAWCTDGAMERVNAVLRARESEGVTMNSSILGISQVQIVGAKAPAKEDPYILVSCMVQQIHCLRKKEEIVEGSDDSIRAVVYIFALQRVYNPDKGGLVWQVAELTYTGGMLYL